jgi:hypothetical protein
VVDNPSTVKTLSQVIQERNPKVVAIDSRRKPEWLRRQTVKDLTGRIAA